MHAYCKKKPSKLWHTLLDDSRQPTSSNSRPAIDKDTFTKAKEIDLLKSFKFKNEEQESSSVVQSSTADKSNLEISGDNLINKIKEEPVDYAFQNVKPREIVTKSTVRVDTHSRTAEKSNLEISADNLSIHNIKEERVDCELLYFKDANHNNHVTESTAQLDTHLSTAKKSTVRLKEDLISDRTKEEPADYEFQEVKHRKIVELDSPELSEILQTDDFGIRLRDYECSNCNSNVVEIVNTEQSNNDDFGIRSKFDKETTECFKCDPNLVGTIEGYNVFLNNANESVHHVTSSL